MRNYLVFMSFAALALVSCAESHAPIAGDREELDLSDEEYLELCEWWKGQWGWPERTYTVCGDGASINPFGDPANCLASRFSRDDLPECHISVQAWYDCAAAMPDWCGPRVEACRRPVECVPEGQPPFFSN